MKKIEPSPICGSRTAFGYAAISGLLLAFAMPPFDLWWLMWVGVLPLLLAIRGQPLHRVIGYSYVTGLIFFSSFWYSVLPWGVGVMLGVCLSFPFFFVCTMALWVWLSPPVPRWARLWLLPLIWVGMEYLWTQWLHMPMTFATTQVIQPLFVQGTSIVGPYGLSFLMVSVNGMLAGLMVSWREDALVAATQTTALRYSYGLIVLLVAANFCYGVWVLRPIKIAQPDASVRVTMFQPATESRIYQRRWVDASGAGDFVDVVLELSKQLPEPVLGQPELIVWPEGGNGYYNLRIPWVRRAIAQLAVNRGAHVAMSSTDLAEDGRRYNSIFWVDSSGRLLDRYDKRFLMPVAEGALTPGKEPTIFSASFGRLGPMICAESNFPEFARSLTRRGAEMLLISSSDASFRRSSLALGHTRMAILRAVESRRPVLLSANVGPSMLIDPFGRVKARSGFWERAILTGTVTPVSKRSIYHTFGYLFAPLMLVLIIALAAFRVRAMRLRWRFTMPVLRPSELAPACKRVITLLALSCVFVVGMVCASLVRVNQQSAKPLPGRVLLADFVHRLPQATLIAGLEFRQASNVTCGSAAVAYLLSALGKRTTEDYVNQMVTVTGRGINLYDLKRAVEHLGFQAWGERQNYEALRQIAKPLIAHVRDDHYVVVTRAGPDDVDVFDPALGRQVRVGRGDFERAWRGVVLLVRSEPIPTILAGADETPARGSST